MCKRCARYGLVSTIAAWAFFAVLLKLLGVANAGINAIWLTLLMFIAILFCPVMNPKIIECCTGKAKKKR